MIKIFNSKNDKVIVITNRDNMNDLRYRTSTISSRPTNWNMYGDRFNTKQYIPYNVNVVNDEDADHYIYTNAQIDTDHGEEGAIDLFDPLKLRNSKDVDEEDEDFDLDMDDEDLDIEADPLQDDTDTFNLDQEQEEDGEDVDQDDNYQGELRTVHGAYLVSKKLQSDSTYTEVWLYTANNNINDMAAINRAILAGTNIDQNTGFSEDGAQKVDYWSAGNVTYVTIYGLGS